MGSTIVHNDLNVDISWDVAVDLVKGLAELRRAGRDMHLPMTVPAFTLCAASSKVVPSRL
jgi:hypothetical protein